MGEEKKYMRRLDFNGELKYIKDEEARADLISEIQIDGEPVEKVNNTVNLVGFATTEYVDRIISNLPKPMVFRGSLGDNGTITELPTDGSASVGDTYKVITNGYGSQEAKVGDLFICDSKTENTNTWTYIPSADDIEDTWREIKVNGSSILGNSISSGLIDFVKGDNINLSYDSNTHKLTITATNTARASDTEIIKTVSEWSAGTDPALGTPIPADDITSWNKGTLPTATVSEGVLRFTQGALPDLQYESKTIPNVTSVGTRPSLTTTNTEVVTEVSI